MSGGYRDLEERLADLAVRMRIARQQSLDDAEPETEHFADALFQWVMRRLPPPNNAGVSGDAQAQLLAQAGFSGPAALPLFRLVRIASAALAGAVSFTAAWALDESSAMASGYAVCGALFGAIAPSYVVTRRARRRQSAISRELADAIDLLVVCVEAGLGLHESVKIVGQEAEHQKLAIGRELSLVSADIAAGGSMGQALRNLADRTAVEDIRPLAATLIQSEQLGAQIAPALRASSDALATRRRLRAEEAAQKVSVKILFPLVLLVLPAMMTVVLGPAMIHIFRTLMKE
jgi:tight adherence protein C